MEWHYFSSCHKYQVFNTISCVYASIVSLKEIICVTNVCFQYW